jgi:LytS/YehU family sensor histidine kinase
VNLSRANGSFTFLAENSKENQRTTEAHGGIGLNNVKRRLELLYPGKHELKIEETESNFSVILNLQLS